MSNPTQVEAERLAARIGRLLDGRTMACAESCTAGLVAQTLAATDGSMPWFRGGVVAYQRGVKFALLGVTPGPVVTRRAACEMAIGVRDLFDVDVAVAVTGAAGPEPLDGAEPGTIVVGVVANGRDDTFVHDLGGSPPEVCSGARTAALADVVALLENSEAIGCEPGNPAHSERPIV
jgi:nicotinamide-nucleotide amidase